MKKTLAVIALSFGLCPSAEAYQQCVQINGVVVCPYQQQMDPFAGAQRLTDRLHRQNEEMRQRQWLEQQLHLQRQHEAEMMQMQIRNQIRNRQ